MGLVIDAPIQRHMPGTVGPQQRDQISAAHDVAVLGRPVPVDQFHVTGIRLVQRRVINDQNTFDELDLSARFLPQRVRIGPQGMQQAGNCSYLGPVSCAGCTRTASM